MEEEMLKSLTDLIDESLAEIEELKKSDRFSASEVSLGDSKSGIESKDKNGSLGKEDDDKDDKDDKDDDDKDDNDKDMDKADGKNSESDPNAGKHQVTKGDDNDDDDDDDDDDDCKKGEMMAGDSNKGSSTGGSTGKNSESDPNAGKHQVVKSNDESNDYVEELKKSREESEDLLKSYIDTKVGSLETKLAGIADMIKDIANSPVPSKGASYKNVTPLQKSEPEAEILSKSEVANKLFELKKSGEAIDTKDITSVELGSPSELSRIIMKYNIK